MNQCTIESTSINSLITKHFTTSNEVVFFISNQKLNHNITRYDNIHFKTKNKYFINLKSRMFHKISFFIKNGLEKQSFDPQKQSFDPQKQSFDPQKQSRKKR